MTTRILKIAVVKENQTKSESGSSGLFDKKGKYAKLLKNSAVRNFSLLWTILFLLLTDL